MRRLGIAIVLAWFAVGVCLAQAPVPRVAWVTSGSEENSKGIVEAARVGLAAEGFEVGRNVSIDWRFLGGRVERYNEVFAELVRTPVAVLAAGGFQGISAARDAGRSRIPVVGFFCGNDVTEMVAEFARPGGNITGVSCLATELAVKRFDLLRDALPRIRKVGFFYDSRNPGKLKELADVRRAAAASGIAVIAGPADSVDDIARCIASLKSAGAEALLISEDVFTFGNRARIVGLAAQAGLPNMAAFREFVVDGGMLSYGGSVPERIAQQARYIGRILKGAKPADLPVDQSMRFEFVINAKVARSLGVVLPAPVLLRADEVLE